MERGTAFHVVSALLDGTEGFALHILSKGSIMQAHHWRRLLVIMVATAVTATSLLPVRGYALTKATTPRQVVTRYFADLAAHRIRAAWLLEAPCAVGSTFSNGPGAPVGSEGYGGRGMWVAPRTSNYGTLRSVRVKGIRQLHFPILTRHHIRAFGLRGWFTFDYSRIPLANLKHKNGFHTIKIAVWQCSGRWGVEGSEWLAGSGGELTWM